MLRKRPYLHREWCERVLAHPFARQVQPDGRIRFWGIITRVGQSYFTRRVTLADGETVHYAFPDRNFAIPNETSSEES